MFLECTENGSLTSDTLPLTGLLFYNLNPGNIFPGSVFSATFTYQTRLAPNIMHNHILLEIGKKIRKVRRRKKMTVQQLADRAKVSKGLISRIENSRTIPSLPVLIKIISGLEEEINSFFEDIDQEDKPETVVIQRAEDLQGFTKEKAIGFMYYNIMDTSLGDFVFQSTILELAPHSQRDLVTTDGHEFKYIIEGELEYQIGDVTYYLKAGDSLYFNARTPHVPINRSDKPVKMLVIYLLSSE